MNAKRYGLYYYLISSARWGDVMVFSATLNNMSAIWLVWEITFMVMTPLNNNSFCFTI